MWNGYQMRGDWSLEGRTMARAGFLYPGIAPVGAHLGPSRPVFQRFDGVSRERLELLQALERGDTIGDMQAVTQQLASTLAELQRGVTSGMTAFPVRENLEAEAKVLVPTDTPVRNMLPRTVGAGRSSAWKQATSLGGGWGTSLDQPGGLANIRMFFSETAAGSQAPAEHTTVYADKSATYKLLGTFFSVTGLAMAAGRTFQDQLATEKANAITNLMLNEEYALISGDSTSTAAPWGDGTNALGFDGLITLTSTTNGTPAAHIVSAVGPLTLAHVDAQLTRIWKQGGQEQWILVNSQEALSFVHLAEASGSIIRVMGSPTGDVVLGVTVISYKHPVTGQMVPILASRFMPAGTILFGSRYLPDGTPAADVEVLPQLDLPSLAPNENFQGYTAQELAPSLTAPHVYPGIVAVYEVLRMKAATVFAKSTGVTAV